MGGASTAAASVAVSASSSSALDLWHDAVPQAFRFFAAAGVGNIFFFAVEHWLYNGVIMKCVTEDWPKIMRKNKESVSFFLSYLIQISMQHWLNAWLVYGLDTIDTREKYLDTLRGSYAAYATTLVASTIFNGYLLGVGVERSLAFWSTIFGFGIVNYFFLSWVVTGKEEQQQSDSKPIAPMQRKGFLSRGGHQRRGWSKLLRTGTAFVFDPRVGEDGTLRMVRSTGPSVCL